MISFIHNDSEYIEANYVLTNALVYSKGCRSSRDLIKNKNIDKAEYIFAKKKDDNWEITEGKSPKFDKVFLKKTFLDTITELNNNNEIVKDEKGIETTPPIIYLDDEQKFKDEEGNIVEIETRGVQSVDGIFFKVKDVMVGFEMDRLNEVITDDRYDGYKEDIHYKYFICKNTGTLGKKRKKELYLTYEGILRVLFVSHSKKVKVFIKWATETLFTVQLGKNCDKDKLISQIKGVSYENIQELFSINARSLSCIYLTAFNTVEKLREIMNIDEKYSDDSGVYKFGLSKSFEIRKNGHKSEYKKLEKYIDMKLVYFTYIDPLYISEAETEIKNLLMEYKFEWDEHNEIVIIPNNMINTVKSFYEKIGAKYSGHVAEYDKQINDYKTEITKLQTKETIHTKDIEIYEQKLVSKDLEKEIYEQKLISKDLELENLRKEIRILNLEAELRNKK